jgi:hypothetical protein
MVAVREAMPCLQRSFDWFCLFAHFIHTNTIKMVKKKVDPRIRGLIVDGVRKNKRSMFVLVGDYGKDQVENLHKILSKTRVKARPSVLWCYKKELGFSTHRK